MWHSVVICLYFVSSVIMSYTFVSMEKYKANEKKKTFFSLQNLKLRAMNSYEVMKIVHYKAWAYSLNIEVERHLNMEAMQVWIEEAFWRQIWRQKRCLTRHRFISVMIIPNHVAPPFCGSRSYEGGFLSMKCGSRSKQLRSSFVSSCFDCEISRLRYLVTII